MMNSFVIRPATEADSEGIASAIQDVAHYFLSSPPGLGTEEFLSSISQASVLSYINSSRFHYVVGFVGNDLAGIAALRDKKHIYHLFVLPAYHRRGLATLLWQHLKEHALHAGNTEGFTVNSSLHAVPVYSRWGFVPEGPPQIKNGVSFQSMYLPMLGS